MILFRGQPLPARYSAARGRRGLTPIVPDAYIRPATGRMAEWLCNGLQIRVQRFDSASGLQRADAAPLLWVPALIPGSSVVEQAAVNRWVDGSNPSRGANQAGGLETSSMPPAAFWAADRRRDWAMKRTTERHPRTRARAARRKAKLKAKRRRQR